MPGWKSVLLGIAIVAMPVAAHAENAAPTTEPSAVRLAAAKELIAALLPAEQRDAMMEQMIAAMLANVAAGAKQGLDAQTAFDDPRVSKVFEQFLARTQSETVAQLKAEMPALVDAMARAYARRFSETQLSEMKLFFASPTGQAYVRESMSILSDPDVAAWSRDSMARSFDKMPERIDQLRRDLEEVLDHTIVDEQA